MPVKSIQLPSNLYREALHRMELDFLAAPLIGSRRELALSLPKEEGREWSWVAKSREKKGAATETAIVLEKPSIRKARFVRACTPNVLPDLGTGQADVFATALWEDLKTAGCLKAANDPDLPDVCYANTVAIGKLALHAPPQGIRLEAAYTAAQNNAVKILLQQLTEHIAAWSDRAQFDGPAEIREGWLRLRQT